MRIREFAILVLHRMWVWLILFSGKFEKQTFSYFNWINVRFVIQIENVQNKNKTECYLCTDLCDQIMLLPSISSTFYAHIFCTKFWRQKTKVLFSSYVFGVKNALLYEKCARKMMMKLTPRRRLKKIIFFLVKTSKDLVQLLWRL